MATPRTKTLLLAETETDLLARLKKGPVVIN